MFVYMCVFGCVYVSMCVCGKQISPAFSHGSCSVVVRTDVENNGKNIMIDYNLC